jgi:two-component sensor histidine kinase
MTRRDSLMDTEASLLGQLRKENAELRRLLAEARDDAQHRTERRQPYHGRSAVAAAETRTAGRRYRIFGPDPSRRPDRDPPLGEDRFHKLIQAIPQLVFGARDGGQCVWSSPQWTASTDLAETGSLGHGWLAALHPDDRETIEAWDRDAPGRGFDRACRVWRSSEGRYRLSRLQTVPLGRHAASRELDWLCILTDVDDLRSLQDQRRALRTDLQYRVRNIMGVVRSIIQRSAETADTVEEYAAHLDGRMHALARTHAVLTRTPEAAIGLEELVAEELVAQGASGEQQVCIAGPDLRLRAKAAETLGLALHELATNAVKYGALSQPAGRIDVHWTFIGGAPPRGVVLEWQEFGVPMIAASPRRSGFGSEVIERSLPYSLGGAATLQFHPGGMRCRIEFPLDSHSAVPGERIAASLDEPGSEDRHINETAGRRGYKT